MRLRPLVQTVMVLLLTPFFLLPIPGCGGSTSGTGGVTVQGRVVDTTGTPLADTTITALQSGESAQSDANGIFQLNTALSESIDFLIEQNDFSAQSTISNLPANTSTVEVLFTVDRTKGSVKGDTVSITGRENDEKSSSSSSEGSQGSSAGPATPSTPSSSSAQSSDSSSTSSASSEESEDSSSDNDDSSEDSSSSSEDDDRDQSREVEGRITALSGNSVTVTSTTFFTTSRTEYRDRNGKSGTLSSFSVGEKVKAEGTVRNGALELDKLESEED